MKISLLAISLAVVFASCSVPTLESDSCSDARLSLKKLYSLHFDRGFEKGEDYLSKRGNLITDRLKDEIDGPTGFDYLTQTDDPPKAFRIGKCTETGKDEVSLSVLLFWKDDQRDEQREINASMTRTEGRWAVDRVEKAD